MRTTHTYDDSGNRPKIAQANGCGYPVNMIYDGTARVAPLKLQAAEPKADEPTIIAAKPPDSTRDE